MFISLQVRICFLILLVIEMLLHQSFNSARTGHILRCSVLGSIIFLPYGMSMYTILLYCDTN